MGIDPDGHVEPRAAEPRPSVAEPPEDESRSAERFSRVLKILICLAIVAWLISLGTGLWFVAVFSLLACLYPLLAQAVRNLQKHEQITRPLNVAASLVYFASLAWGLSMITQTPFVWVLPGLFGVVFLYGVLTLVWLTTWAHHEDGRLGQFRIGSLFFLTAFVAIFFSVVRWMTVRICTLREISPGSDDALAMFAAIAIGTLGVALTTVKPVLFVIDALLHVGNWLIRRPAVRARLRKRR